MSKDLITGPNILVSQSDIDLAQDDFSISHQTQLMRLQFLRSLTEEGIPTGEDMLTAMDLMNDLDRVAKDKLKANVDQQQADTDDALVAAMVDKIRKATLDAPVPTNGTIPDGDTIDLPEGDFSEQHTARGLIRENAKEFVDRMGMNLD